MLSKSLQERIKTAVEATVNGKERYTRIEVPLDKREGENQFLFFLKPELMENLSRFPEILSFIADKLDTFQFAVEGAAVISGLYLEEFGIVSEHYGIIDSAARDPYSAMTPGLWASFEKTFSADRDAARLVGGVTYLQDHPDLGAEALTEQWLRRGFTRLGSGTYCQYVEEEKVYLINGFYPRLLLHFAREASCIVAFVLRSNTSWRQARRDFTGATVPEEAIVGSIRRDLLDRKADYGLKEISPNLNGIHLSAGPVEALVELRRFMSDRSASSYTGDIPVSNFAFGRLLNESFSDAEIKALLSNSKLKTDEGEITVFDLTEEVDSGAAVKILKGALLV